MLAAGIPYRVYGGLRFFERAEIKDGLAYLRLIANRDDDPSFERVVNTPPRGVGSRTMDSCADEARRPGASLWRAAAARDRRRRAREAFGEVSVELPEPHRSTRQGNAHCKPA